MFRCRRERDEVEADRQWHKHGIREGDADKVPEEPTPIAADRRSEYGRLGNRLAARTQPGGAAVAVTTADVLGDNHEVGRRDVMTASPSSTTCAMHSWPMANGGGRGERPRRISRSTSHVAAPPAAPVPQSTIADPDLERPAVPLYAGRWMSAHASCPR